MSLKLRQTFAYYFIFICLGINGAIVGPALSTLAAHTGSPLSAISVIFVAGSTGRFVGALFGARLYDRVKAGHLVMALGLALMALMLAATPFIGVLALLVAAGFLQGLAETLVDVGGNTLLVWAHGTGVSPFMNGLHFMFGVGTFIAPFLIAQSLNLSGDIAIGYFLAAALVIPAALIALRLPSPAAEHHASANTSGAASMGMALLIAAVFFLMVGVESGYGSWSFNYGTAHGMNINEAAALASTYWGAFTLGRLISIPAATRISTKTYLILDMAGILLGTALVLILPALPWLGMGLVGLSVASAFPTLMSFAEHRMTITGKITGIFLAASNLSGMTMPWLIGQFFESRGPITLPLVMLAASVLALVSLAVLLKMGHKTMDKHKQPATSS